MLSLRSTSSNPSDACPLTLNIPVWIQTVSTGDFPVLGDRVFTDSGGTTPFIGDNDYWRLQFQIDPNNGVSATVDSNGYIGGPIGICPP
jgi:hypothetical protein